ncbi:MAG: hypothetical protein ABH872_04400 [Candidatus Omnitrophota bacterium]
MDNNSDGFFKAAFFLTLAVIVFGFALEIDFFSNTRFISAEVKKNAGKTAIPDQVLPYQKVNVQELRKLISEGKLSDKEALFYTPVLD